MKLYKAEIEEFQLKTSNLEFQSSLSYKRTMSLLEGTLMIEDF